MNWIIFGFFFGFIFVISYYIFKTLFEIQEEIKKLKKKWLNLDKFPEAFRRFEQKEEIDYSKIKDSNQLMKKFAYWQNRPCSPKQRMVIRQIAEKKGIVKKIAI